MAASFSKYFPRFENGSTVANTVRNAAEIFCLHEYIPKECAENSQVENAKFRDSVTQFLHGPRRANTTVSLKLVLFLNSKMEIVQSIEALSNSGKGFLNKGGPVQEILNDSLREEDTQR